MKVVQINTTCGVGSTGKIAAEISKLLSKENIENYIFYSDKSNGYEKGIKFSNKIYLKFQALKSRLFGNYGFNSNKSTYKMIKKLEQIKPDIIHLHNIHGHDCNLEILFKYIREKNIKIIWTFHDCWAFTAYCPHFSFIKCSQWENGCIKCPEKNLYSWFIDRSKYLFEKKNVLFESIDMTVVTPSEWLADLTRKSFLKNKEVKVINNGIDLEIFKSTDSNFREKYNISKNKKIILGVSFGWSYKKGLDVFIELSNRLDKDRYQIVLVGTNKKIDKILPDNIISIHKTLNQRELAGIYTAADLFINPTREENYPTVNMESIACGTPVISFRTGGSPEIINKNTGVIVEYNDIDTLETVIIEYSEDKNLKKCIHVNEGVRFDANICFKKYISLYKSIFNNNE